jgi:hypothetical protein
MLMSINEEAIEGLSKDLISTFYQMTVEYLENIAVNLTTVGTDMAGDDVNKKLIVDTTMDGFNMAVEAVRKLI